MNRKSARPRTIRASQPVASLDEVSKPLTTRKPIGIARSVGRPIEREDIAAQAVAFKPTAVSTESSSEKNDPLLKSSILIEGASSGTLCKRLGKFSNDFSGYVQLVLSSYEASAKRDAKFGKSISESQYYYYCVVLLWRRLVVVCCSHGDDLRDLRDFLLLRLSDLAVPEDIADYLSGIGDVTDFAGVPWTIQLGVALDTTLINGLAGHYGKVDALTHAYYETIPSPFVALAWLIQDYAFTVAPRSAAVPADWDLPASLRPDAGEDGTRGVPNRNLLGWFPSKKMTDGQLKLSLDNDVYATVSNRTAVYVVTGVENRNGFPLAVGLVGAISATLFSSRAGPVVPETTSLSGSKAQVLYIARSIEEQENPTTVGANLAPVFQGAGTPISCSATSANMMSACSLFRYRINRLNKDHTDSLCYTVEGGAALPGWMATANIVFQSCPQWSTQNYRETERYADNSTRAYCLRIRGSTAE